MPGPVHPPEKRNTTGYYPIRDYDRVGEHRQQELSVDVERTRKMFSGMFHP
jgi:hypothetical protein